MLFENETSDIDSLTERLCVSRSTIQKDILDVKRWLSQQGLDLSYKKEHGLFIIGNEILIRYAMVNYLADSNFSSSLPELSDYSNTPGLVHFNSIKHILEQIHETEKVSFSDAEFLNLAIYLSVTLARLEKQKEIMQNELEGFQLENKKEYGLAFKVAQLLEQTWQSGFQKPSASSSPATSRRPIFQIPPFKIWLLRVKGTWRALSRKPSKRSSTVSTAIFPMTKNSLSAFHIISIH